MSKVLEMEGIKPTVTKTNKTEEKKKSLPPIRRERLESGEIAEIITREAERINLLDVKAIIQTLEVKVFERKEKREVINIGDNVIIYGLYHRITDNEGTFRDVFYEVVPISNLASAYCKDIHEKGIIVSTPRRAARLAIIIEVYCRLFVGLAVSPEVALSINAGLDGPNNSKARKSIGWVSK